MDDNVSFQFFCNQLKKTEDYTSVLKQNVQLAGRKGTPMMGELPVFVAALTLDKEKVQAILTIDTKCLRYTNSKGDTIIHSLIRLAPYRPDARTNIIEMIKYIYEVAKHIDKDPNWTPPKVGVEEKVQVKGSKRKKRLEDLQDNTLVWHLFRQDNKKGYSPLELATTKCVPSIFSYILSLEQVYLKGGKTHGANHRKIYDISEIDSKSNLLYRTQDAKTCMAKWKPSSESIMEMMFGKYTLTATAVEMVKTSEIMRYLIRVKWEKYQKLFFIWFLAYMTILVWVTAYMSYRIDVLLDRRTQHNFSLSLSGDLENDFTVVTAWILLPVDCFGLALLVVLFFTRTIGRNNPAMYTMHNLDYVLSFFVFVVGIMIDSIIILSDGVKPYSGECMTVAVVSGWWFATIFLRPFKQFGRLVDLVRRVIIQDILSFASLFIILLIGFASGLHSLFKYKSNDSNNSFDLVDEHSSLWRSSFTLFNVMLGLSELHGDDNSIYGTSASWLAITMYIVFIIVAYALLLNALIAIMTLSCGSIFEDAYDYQRVHKLSVMIFMEELFGLNHIFRYQLLIYDPRTNSDYAVGNVNRGSNRFRSYAEVKIKGHDSEEWQQNSQSDRRGKSDKREVEENVLALINSKLKQVDMGISKSVGKGPYQEKQNADLVNDKPIEENQTYHSENGSLDHTLNSLFSQLRVLNSHVKSVDEKLSRLEVRGSYGETQVVHTVETVCKQCRKTECIQNSDESIKLDGSQSVSEYSTTLSIT